MRKAPRPFYEQARRSHRLGFGIPKGKLHAALGWPWYYGPRRRPAVTAPPSAMQRAKSRRYWAARPALCYDYDGEVW